jgi:hypothetical protein
VLAKCGVLSTSNQVTHIVPTVHYSPTDTQVKCLKNNIEIYTKTAPTCFGAVTPSSGSALFVLAKVTVVKIANSSSSSSSLLGSR